MTDQSPVALAHETIRLTETLVNSSTIDDAYAFDDFCRAHAPALARAVIAMDAALRQIERWDGFPPTGDGTSGSYGTQFGSNGERDFMRGVATAALTLGEGRPSEGGPPVAKEE